ncbi:hypothetical protein ScPMuIL_000757 [Solemya velum]
MSLNIPGLIGIIVFYVLILVVGLWAGRKSRKSTNSDELFLANRDIGMGVSICTIAATGVGAAYINGTAEAMAKDGFLWTQAPFGYNIGIAVAALFYATKLRKAGYTTLFDPIQEKYGAKMGGVLFFPELLGELFWEAAILVALGTTLSIVLNINSMVAIIGSACIAVVYTFLGGLYSVAYTDIIQLICVAFGLILCIPFAWNNPAVDLSRIKNTWLGTIPNNMVGTYIDTYCLLIGGGIPWQVYYQRVLACRTPEIAVKSSLIGIAITFLLGIPPAIIGVIGSAADWNSTAYEGEVPIPPDKWVFVLPMVLQYLCPTAVAVIGIGAVSAAAMSSTDSLILCTGTVFARNIYKNIIRPQASDREEIWVLRISIVVVGVAGTAIALTVNSVYGLFVICADLMYIIQFPQLTCLLWVPFSNTYGSLLGFLFAFVFRVLGGEHLLNLPAAIKYPFYNNETGQAFPHKTLAMAISFTTILGVSFFTDRAFKRGWIPMKYDIFHCFDNKRLTKRRQDEKDAMPLDDDKQLQLEQLTSM